MHWSQLKKRIEALFADTVQGRVELHTTRYHKAHDQMGRGWITIDKVQIINMCDYNFECRQWEEASRLRQTSGNVDFRNPAHQEGYYQAYDQAQETLHAKAVFPRWEFTRSLFDYLNMPVTDILKSPNPIFRALGMLDHRVGKRRLTAVDVTNEHPLVQKLFAFRCEAEGLTGRTDQR
jgi:hypothetical protein